MSRATDAMGNLMAPVATNTNATQQSAVREANNDLDRNAFLNLLITQLRFQDPLNPMDDREFIAQLAQFSSLEQMQNLNSTFGRFQAFNMINQHVFGLTRDSATAQVRAVTGIVESVRMINGEPWLVIGSGNDEQMIRASDVQTVTDHTLAATLSTMMEMTSSNIMNQNLAMVGRYVQAITDDGRGNAGFLEGRVEFVDFSGNPPMLVIGNERVHLAQITSVADRMMLIGQNIGHYVDGQLTYGQITGVRLVDENLYLVVQSGGVSRDISIDAVNFATEAIRLYRDPPTQVSFDGVTGFITHVFANNGHVWIRINNGGPIRMSDFLRVVTPEPEEDIPWRPPAADEAPENDTED